jgi:hypothetical protein
MLEFAVQKRSSPMTRSVRQTPFLPNSAHESEKNDKQLAHQRERKWIKDHLHPEHVNEDFDLAAPHEHPKSGRDSFAKKGKALAQGEPSARRK